MHQWLHPSSIYCQRGQGQRRYPSLFGSVCVTDRNTAWTSHKSITVHTPFTHTLTLMESPVNLMCIYLLYGTKHKMKRQGLNW